MVDHVRNTSTRKGKTVSREWLVHGSLRYMVRAIRKKGVEMAGGGRNDDDTEIERKNQWERGEKKETQYYSTYIVLAREVQFLFKAVATVAAYNLKISIHTGCHTRL